MENTIKNCEDRMGKSIASLESEYLALRTGRASAAIFDKVKVDYYGSETPLSQVASVSVPEARLVVIQPWDKSLLGAIEKAIQKADLGLNPSNDGKLLRISFPALTGDRRKELAKTAKTAAENAKVAIRNIRRDGMDAIKRLQKDGDISEDEQKSAEERLQKMTDSYIAKASSLADAKEKEIMEI